MPTVFNSGTARCGIWRSIIVDANIFEYRVYIPALHKDQNPFSDPQDINSGINIDDNGFIQTSNNKIKLNIKDYPRAITCSHLCRYNLKVGDCVWVIFENSDENFPIIVGQLGSILPVGNITEYLDANVSFSDKEGGMGSYSDIYTGDNEPVDYSMIEGWGYPLKKRHTLPINDGRQFGASRSGGTRAHAGIDLIVPEGTPVIAMDDGIVIENNKNFYQNTDALLVKHNNGMSVNYAEIKSNLKSNTIIKKGQVIGEVIKNRDGTQMLHIECYKGDSTGHLLIQNGRYLHVDQKNYGNRRCDLMDPTFIADLPGGEE